MAEIYIHIPGGEQLSIVPEASSSQDWALMGDNKLSLSFQRYECLILPAGAWCEFDGVIFYLLQEYKPTMIHSHLWQYNVAFVDGASWLGVTTALKTIDGEDAPLFTLTAPAIEHATIIVSNLNRRLGTTMWKVGSVIDTPNITIEYTGKYCGAVLQEIVDDQNTEWWVDGTTLNIGRAEFGSLIELGYRDGLLGDITVTHADNMSSYRTLYPVGSTRNILPTEYGHDRLQLPNGQRSVMMNPAGVAELVEEAAFAGIYPRYKGKVTGVSTSIGQSNDGSQYLIYIVADTAIPFNPNEYEMPGLVKHITFQSGELMGAEFEVNYNPVSNEFELITQFQENGNQLPGGMLIPQVGDEYVVWNISMPAEYYPLAEQELLEAAESFAAASTRESNVYKVKLDYIDVQERGLSLRPGQKVRLHSVDYFPEQGYYDSRITRVTRPVNYPGEYTIDVSAVRVVGSLTRLQTSLAAATTKVNNLSNTVQTVVQTVSNAVTLTGNQRVKGVKDFVDGVRIGGLFASKLKDDTLYFDGNIVLRGGLTMYGKNTTTSPSIFSALPIDGTTIGRNERGELYVIGGTGGGSGSGGGISIADVESYLTTNGYATQDWVTGKGYITSASSITGNAATATKLATTRSIWGQSFDGSADVSGNIFPTNTSGCYYNENGISYHTNKQYQDVILRVTPSYNVAIGGTTALDKLHVYGRGRFVMQGKSDQSSIVTEATALTLSTNSAGHTGYNTGIGFNVLGDYSNLAYKDHIHAWIGLGGATTTLTSECYPLVFATNPNTSIAGTPVERMRITPDGNVAIGGETASEKLHVYGNILATGTVSSAGGKFTDNVVIAEGKNIMMRSANAQYLSGIGYDTSGNECLALWAKNSVTRLRWSAGIDLSAGVNTGAMMGITPDFEISKATGAAIGYIAGNTILHSDNYSNYALPLTGGVVDGDVYSKNYRTDGVAYIQRLRIENLNEINGYSTYNGGSATGNAHINYASSGIVTLCNGGGNCAIGGISATEKLHVYGNMLFDGERVLKSSLIGEVLYMGGSYLVIGGGTTAKRIPTYIDGKTVYVRAGNYVATFSDAGGLTWNGNLLANGAITMYYSSDKRLKKNIRKVNASKMLMSLGGVYQYNYINSEVQKNHIYGGTHYGLIYQNVKGTALSSMCHEREDGYGSLNYLDTNFISLIAGATMEHCTEIEKLKKENKALKKRVEKLEKRVA